MRYKFTLEISDDADVLAEALLPEISERERSSLKIERKGNSLVVLMDANDATALRATVTSLTKLLIVHEKIKKVKNDSKERSRREDFSTSVD